MACGERLAYCRNEALRTPQLSEPFRVLGNFQQKRKMADRKGFEPSRRLPAYSLSRGAPSTTRPPVHLSGYAVWFLKTSTFCRYYNFFRK